MGMDILSKLLQLAPSNTNMELPPKVFVDMRGEFIEFVEGISLTARFPNMERYMNPFGYMQGGIIVAAMDNTISPLSYVSAPPNITKEINTKYKRRVKASDQFIDVVGTVAKKTTSNIILHAEVLNEKGKLAAKGVANCVFIKGIRGTQNAF